MDLRKTMVTYSRMVTALFLFMSIIKPSSSTFMHKSKHEYRRYHEAKIQCSQILQSASELKFHINAKSICSFQRELTFNEGDWEQVSAGSKPFVPILLHRSMDSSTHTASFWLVNVEADNESPSTVKVSGHLHIGANNMDQQDGLASVSDEFEFLSSRSLLKIMFEGIYTESKLNGGERVLCLLGKKGIPLALLNSSSPHEQQQDARGGGSSNKLGVLQDDKILMILRYPKSLSLTRRDLRGEITSTRDPSDPLYFDKIKLFHYPGTHYTYEFGPEALIPKTCSPSYPYQVDIYKGHEVCQLLRHYQSKAFVIDPNWKCNSTDEYYCDRLGPFNSSRVIGGVFQNIKLVMQDVRCESEEAQSSGSSARVSALVQLVNERDSERRTSLDRTKISVEGAWNSDAGQLCMVGCLGPEYNNCDSIVSIFFPMSFSISQRSVIIGSIWNSSSHRTESYYPLSFQRRVSLHELQGLDYSAYISYKYTKLMLANAFLKMNEQSNNNPFAMNLILSYPRVEDSKSREFGVHKLVEDLNFEAGLVSDSPTHGRVSLQIRTVGSCFRSWIVNRAECKEHKPMNTASEEGADILNLSATLFLSEHGGDRFDNISKLTLEGLYNPADGSMYLIGCRDVRASWKVLIASTDLENGMDCSIEVRVEYPPTTVYWLFSKSVRISVSSKRNNTDPLHFNPVELNTNPIMYTRQLEGMFSKINVMAALQLLTLPLEIACIYSQLISIRKDTSSAPYISMVMLGVLAFDYGLASIGGAEKNMIFAKNSNSIDNIFNGLVNNQPFHPEDYLVKILSLVAFLFVVRIAWNVCTYRARLLSHMSSAHRVVPSDNRVFVAWLCIHMVGFLAMVGIDAITKESSTARSYVDANSRGWGAELTTYAGVVKGFFLLPQVIGNFLWQYEGAPLGKMYYLGITVLRLPSHVLIPMALDFQNEYELTMFMTVPVDALFFAVLVYLQQNWKLIRPPDGVKLSQGTMPESLSIATDEGKHLCVGQNVEQDQP